MKEASKKTKKRSLKNNDIDYSKFHDLESPAQDEWFFETTGPQGQPLVYLRFNATGWTTRRIGPYASRKDALLDLDAVLNELACQWDEQTRERDGYVRVHLKGNNNDFIMLEDPLFYLHQGNGHCELSPKGA